MKQNTTLYSLKKLAFGNSLSVIPTTKEVFLAVKKKDSRNIKKLKFHAKAKLRLSLLGQNSLFS